MTETNLETLTARWLAAKENEAVARAKRHEIETAIAASHDLSLPDEGTTHVGPLVIRTAFSRTWDLTLLDNINETRPNLWPFRREWKEVRKESEIVERNFPELWARLSGGLTLTPKRPYFSVTKRA